MATLTVIQYYAIGRPQLVGLSGDALINAQRSLIAQSPTETPLNAEALLRNVTDTLPHFVLDAEGRPVLVVPQAATPPPAPAPQPPGSITPPPGPPPPPTNGGTQGLLNGGTQTISPTPAPLPGTGGCPPGQVPATAFAPATPAQRAAELQTTVQSALTAAGVGQKPANGCPTTFTCTPTLAVQHLVGANDAVYITAASGSPFSPVILINVRVLDCNCQIHNYESRLPVNQVVSGHNVDQKSLCIPLTDGYLLSVMTHQIAGCAQSGEIWVQAALRTQGCKGQVVAPLFSGYLTAESFLGWPPGQFANWGDGPGADYSDPLQIVFASKQLGFTVPFGQMVRLKSVVVGINSSAAAGNRRCFLDYTDSGTNVDLLFGGTDTQPPSSSYLWCFAHGVNPGTQPQVAAVPTWNGTIVVSIPIPDNISDRNPAGFGVYIDHWDAADVIFYRAISYKAWVETPNLGWTG